MRWVGEGVQNCQKGLRSYLNGPLVKKKQNKKTNKQTIMINVKTFVKKVFVQKMLKKIGLKVNHCCIVAIKLAATKIQFKGPLEICQLVKLS